MGLKLFNHGCKIAKVHRAALPLIKGSERGGNLAELGDEALCKLTHLIFQILFGFLGHIGINGVKFVYFGLPVILQRLYLLLKQFKRCESIFPILDKRRRRRVCL